MPDFDSLDRSWLEGRPGAKWHRVEPGVLSAWVADMDFPTAEPIRAAIRAYAERADFGYPDWNPHSPLRDLFCERMSQRFGWDVSPRYVRETCDVLQTVELALHTATSPGDPVAVFCPSYHPILRSLEHMNRPLVPIMLEPSGAGWGLDAERFARAVAESGARAIILLNPHNPTGHVFSAEELHIIAKVAAEHDLLVISDEIHADLVFEGTHIPFASLGPDVEARTVTATSATKAFNIAGVRAAIAHVGSATVRAGWQALPSHLVGAVSALGVDATVAAWTDCDDWLDAVTRHLDRNRHLLADLLAAQLPATRYRPPAATYLAWVDCEALGLGDNPRDVFLERSRVQLSPGIDFGPGGEHHVRINIATSASILTEIVERMALTVRT